MTAMPSLHRLRPRVLVVLMGVVAGLTVASCDSGPDGSPEQAAEELAAAIETGDFSDITVVDGTAEQAAAQRAAAYEGLGDLPLTTEVVSVEQHEDLPRATATVRLSWDLPGDGEDLQIESAVRLKVSQDAWAVRWEHANLGVPLGQILRLEQVPSARADIVDRDGEPLLTDRPVWRFGIDKTTVGAEQAEESARLLAEAAGLDQEAYADSVAAAGPEAFVDLITYRHDDPEGKSLHAQIADIDGAAVLDEERMLGPTRTFAQPLLGTVGPVTAEMIEQDPDRFIAGEVAGLSGLSQAFDEQLTGTGGTRVTVIDADSRAVRDTLLEEPPQQPEALRTTLDSRLQRAAEAALAEVGPPSAIVAIEPSSGDVLASANGPGSDGADTALSTQYAPGSTSKLISALVLLRHGMTPESTVRCEPHLVVDGYRFTNVPGYPEEALGDIPLVTALAHSCNTALISLRDEIPMAELAQAATDLGLGAVWDMPVTAFSGVVPETADSETEHGASLIGQGRVLASPAAMATVAASIAEGGPVVPRVVAGQDVPEPTGSLTAEESAHLREVMRAVVTDGGASMLADNPGPPVLAKTGTAEFGSQDPPQTHVWMIAIQGDLAVAVFVEEGDYGSTTAGPIMDAFLTAAVG